MPKRHPAGKECQCVACGEFFSAESPFLFHQHWQADQLTCLDPASIGLVPKSHRGGPAWGIPLTGVPYAQRRAFLRQRTQKEAPRDTEMASI